MYLSLKAETSTFAPVAVETWMFLSSFCLKDDKCEKQQLTPPESHMFMPLVAGAGRGSKGAHRTRPTKTTVFELICKF